MSAKLWLNILPLSEKARGVDNFFLGFDRIKYFRPFEGLKAELQDYRINRIWGVAGHLISANYPDILKTWVMRWSIEEDHRHRLNLS